MAMGCSEEWFQSGNEIHISQGTHDFWGVLILIVNHKCYDKNCSKHKIVCIYSTIVIILEGDVLSYLDLSCHAYTITQVL